MTTPILGITEMEQAQLNPHLIVNGGFRALEAALGRGFTQVFTDDAEDYGLTADDNGAFIARTRATAQTVTVPDGLPAGFTAHIWQGGAGELSFVEGSGVTIHVDTLDLRARYSAASLIQIAPDEYALIGDMAVEETS